MATYTTNLKDWGATGSEYPDGYNYEDDVPPVDLYDNFLTSNLITDVQHLIGLTNNRIEADKGGSGGEPTSPEDSHLYHDQGNDRLEVWDGSTSSWRGLLYSDGDTMSGSLDMGGFGVTGTGDITDDNGNTIYDLSAGHVPVGQIEQGSGSTLNADQVDGKDASELGSGVSDNGTEVVSPATDFNFGSNLDVADDGDGTVTITAQSSSDSHTAVSEGGAQMYGSVDDINFKGFLNLIDDGDGTVSLDPAHNHDSRYYTQSEADSNFDNFGSFTVTEGNGSETSTIGSGGNISIYGGTDISTEMDASDNLQVSMTGNYDNYSSWTIEEGDGEQTNIYSGNKLEIYGGTDINTEITSTGGESRLSVRHDNTTSQGDVNTSGSTIIDYVNLDGNGHVTGMGTRNIDTGVSDHANLSGVGANDHHAQNHDNSDHTTNYLPSSNYNPEADTHSPPSSTQSKTINHSESGINVDLKNRDGSSLFLMPPVFFDSVTVELVEDQYGNPAAIEITLTDGSNVSAGGDKTTTLHPNGYVKRMAANGNGDSVKIKDITWREASGHSHNI
jgi:hypothetical protein